MYKFNTIFPLGPLTGREEGYLFSTKKKKNSDSLIPRIYTL